MIKLKVIRELISEILLKEANTLITCAMHVLGRSISGFEQRGWTDNEI